MPLRKPVALLNIEQSALSKIELNERQKKIEIIPLLAKAFGMTEKEVSVKFWGEKIADHLKDEPFRLNALKMAENK